MESIIVALVSGGLSLVGVVFTCLVTAKKQEKATAVAQAIMDTKLDVLTREVREHNNFALRMPVVEHDIKDLQRRVAVLEKFHLAQN